MPDKYILKGKMPVLADLMTWAQWYESADRHVAAGALQHGPGSAIFKQFALDIADQIRTTE